jgi:hypothetical protein
MDSKRVLCLFKNDNGETLGSPIDLQIDIKKANLESLMQKLDPTNEVREGAREREREMLIKDLLIITGWRIHSVFVFC